MSKPRRSGPGGGAKAPSSVGSGATSVKGSEVEIARVKRRGSRLVLARVLIHWPLTSRILMVTGQMMSVASPREPAKTASAPRAVENGQERTERCGDDPGTSTKKAIWLTRPKSR